MKKVLVIGSFMTDLVVQTGRMPHEGETYMGTAFNMFTGGKGANQAVQTARLGVPVTMVGALGNDSFGEAHLKSLREAGIDASNVISVSGVTSGVGNVLLEPNGDNRIIIVPGANTELSADYIDSIESVIDENDIIVLQLEVPVPTVIRAIELAKGLGKTIILNPAPAQKLPSDVLADVDYIMPNEKELGVLTDLPTDDYSGIKDAAQKLLETGVKNVIVTLGSHGALFATTDKMTLIPSYKVLPVDTTAAGDSFIGAFASELAKNCEEMEALDFAARVAAITTTGLGSQPSLPTTDVVGRKFNKGELIQNEKVEF
ncbi:ribokinase [Lacticaseibacillus nasuensis]|uniref:ribokinase n=1 Tax=Lacticaseibacillus nasuensis TaxID=944671 RepID=UPI00224751E7|nr:ribokinase [Lacticaseibacillus nasuensis]MCX2455896.1 ribokinase [Lacticaseibacillus nasuensis]